MTDSGTKTSDAPGTSAAGLTDAQAGLDAIRRETVSWLLSGLMHESRNALQQISAGAELLALDLAGRPDAMHLIQGIEDGQNRLTRVLDDLRLYATPPEPTVQSLDLAATVRRIWHSLATSGRWPAAELHEVDMPADCHCRADPGLLSAAILRLLEFVLAAGGSPSLIEIGCRQVQLSGQPALALTLRSPGMTWTAAEEPLLFEPFAIRRGRTTGLELTVARRLVELQGGRLRQDRVAGEVELVLELPR